ncbi:hypothetical protein OIO90_003917 [Microbotryomycetes sp. JL221]|nr:hypothetical protein OIO90_003917 [Microbotryomycetes sp. JL221]
MTAAVMSSPPSVVASTLDGPVASTSNASAAESFSFARTPSLAQTSMASSEAQRDEEASSVEDELLRSMLQSRRTDVFPSKPSRARLARSNSDASSQMTTSSSAAFSTTSSGQHHARSSSYAPPPGLTSNSTSSLSSKPVKPRGARVDYQPPLPAAAHWLLLTTPPPPAGTTLTSRAPASSSSLHDSFSSKLVLDHNRARDRRQAQHQQQQPQLVQTKSKPSSSSTSKRKTLAAALGFKGQHTVVPPPIDWSSRNVEAYAAPSRASRSNGSVQLQLGPGSNRSRSSFSTTTSGGSSLRSSHASSRATATRRGTNLARLDSRSLAFEVPKTWDEYASLYARGIIDIEDPPFPPIAHGSDALSRPSPYQEGNYNAPSSPFEHLRRRLLLNCNLLGEQNSSSFIGDNNSVLSGPVSATMVPLPSGSSTRTTRSSNNGHDSILFNRRDSGAAPTGGKRDSYASTTPSSMFSSPNMNNMSPFPTKNAKSPSIASRAITNHPAIVQILERARKLFGTRMSFISVLDDQRQILLATDGIPEHVDSLPKAATICSHTLLNGEKGLIVLDTQRDWRFRNNVMSVVLGIRFYAAMPVFGPSEAELEEAAGGRIAVGTIAIVDDQPRGSFTPAERAKLRSLATDASNEISAWCSGRRSSIASSFTSFNSPQLSSSSSAVPSMSRSTHRPTHSTHSTSSYIDWQTNTNAVAASRPSSGVDLTTSSTSPRVAIDHRSPSSVDEEQDDREVLKGLANGSTAHSRQPLSSTARRIQHGRNASDTSSVCHSDYNNATHSNKPTFPSTTVRELPQSSRQKVFDLATKTLGQGLDLSLVYLVSLNNLETNATSTTSIKGGIVKLNLLSSWNLPQSTPSFDASLHLKALRAPEGGLLFKNPLVNPSQQPTGSSTTSTQQAYASGILLPVVEHDGTGYVLAGYTKDSKREFDEQELNAFLQVVEQLQKVLCPL